jgi:hypothetical protein
MQGLSAVGVGVGCPVGLSTLRGPKSAKGHAGRSAALVVEAKESRIGKAPVKVPKGVTVTIDGQKVSAKVRRCVQRALACVEPMSLFLRARADAAVPAGAR